MSTPATVTDIHGNRYAPVHIEELDEWAWMLRRIEDWLLHASPETIEDWDDFTGPGGPRIDHVTYMLGHWTTRMRRLAEGETT